MVKVEEYFPRVVEIAKQMSLFGEVINDKKLVESILISLTKKSDL